MADDRYQKQHVLIKVSRRIKWKPFYFVKAASYILGTFFNRDILWDPDEKAYFKRSFIFGLILTEADIKMKHYYTMDEIKK